MKLSSFVTFLGSSLPIAAVLEVRQQQCSENSCYRAVWGDGNLSRIVQVATDCQTYLTTTVVVHPVTTVTLLTRTTSTTTPPCPTVSMTSIISLSTDVPTLSAQDMIILTARQASSTDWFTTTTYGPFPSYATPACRPAGYASACSCAGITQGDITYLGTSKTSTATTTLTEVLTRTTSCPVIIMPSSRGPSTSSTAYTTSHTSDASNSSISSSSSASSSSSLSSSGISTLSSSTASIISSSSSSGLSSATSSSSSASSGSSSSSSQGSSTSTSTCTTTGTLSHSSAVPSSSSGTSSDQPSTPSSSPPLSSSSTSSPSNPSLTISSSETSSSSHSSVASHQISSSASSTLTGTSFSLTSSGSSTTLSASSSSSSSSQTSTSPSSTDTTSTATPTPSPPICGGVGVELCDGGCHDTKTDLQHCGRCGNKCGAGKDCVNGVCASPPCDSRCGWDRMCGSRNGTVECTCATAVEGHGICFDRNRFKCDDPNLIKCQASAYGRGGCPVGSACVKEYCNCGTVPFSGICVKTEGCGDGGVEVLGPLIRLGDAERRRRTIKEFGV